MSGSLLVLLFEGYHGHIGFLAAAVLIIRLGKKGAEWIHLTFSASSVIGFIGFVRRLHPGNRRLFSVCFICSWSYSACFYRFGLIFSYSPSWFISH